MVVYLQCLKQKDLSNLAEGIDKSAAEVKDIVDNPKNIEFDANYEAALIATNVQ